MDKEQLTIDFSPFVTMTPFSRFQHHNFPIRRFRLTHIFVILSQLENIALIILRNARRNAPKEMIIHTIIPFLTQKDRPSHPSSRSKASVVGFVRTNDYRRTDVSAPSYRRVRTKTTTCPHFLEPEGARFSMCEIASVRVKRPTEGNGWEEKGDRRKRNRQKGCHSAKRKSPEKALRGHQLVFWCKEAPSRAIRLTF